MILRLSQKLNAKIKGDTLTTMPLDENPFADWSAGLFQVGRSHFILVTNTKSLYSMLLSGKGVTDETTLVASASNGIREFLDADGYRSVYDRSIASLFGSVQFAKALNRSVIGSMKELAMIASFFLEEGDRSLIEISSRLNGTPMTGLKQDGSTHGFPRKVFADLVESSANP